MSAPDGANGLGWRGERTKRQRKEKKGKVQRHGEREQTEGGVKEGDDPPFCYLSHLQRVDWRLAEIQGHRVASSRYGQAGHIR